MAVALALVNGVPRQQTIPGTSLIYDQSVSIVASGGSAGSNSVNGPVTSGTPITLPSSGSYTLNANSVANVQIFLNGDRLEQTFDWVISGTGPNYTAVAFTFNLVVNDRVDFLIERTS